MFVLELPGNTWPPADAVVGAGHVRDRSSCGRCPETVGLSNHIGDLVATPTVPLNTDCLLIHKACGNHGIDGGEDTLQRTLAGLTDRINDVRLQNEIPVAHVIA